MATGTTSREVPGPAAPARHPFAAFGGGAVIGTLRGLIGLGGAEFRLPLLLGPFRFRPLEAVIFNKAMSLIVVATALPFRARAVPLREVAAYWPVIVNLLAGSLIGAWLGAGWATRLRSGTLYRVIAALLVLIAAVLVVGHGAGTGEPLLTGPAQVVTGVVAGLGIGILASLLGVPGGELLIPTLVLLYGLDVKLAGSLSLAVSLPTMVMGFARYSQDRSFTTLGRNRAFLLVMAAGSVAGAFVGGLPFRRGPRRRAAARIGPDPARVRLEGLGARPPRLGPLSLEPCVRAPAPRAHYQFRIVKPCPAKTASAASEPRKSRKAPASVLVLVATTAAG